MLKLLTLLIYSFIFLPAFLLERVAGGLQKPQGQQQFHVILLAPYQVGTKQCCHFAVTEKY